MPRVRRRILIDDEIEDTPARTSTTEPVLIYSDEDTEPRDNNKSIQHLFDSGFGSDELDPVFDEAPLTSFVPISSIPLPTISISLPILTTSVLLPVSTAPMSVPTLVSTSSPSIPVSASSPSIPSIATLPSVHHTETGSSSGSMTMRSVTLKVPANHSLLRKTEQLSKTSEEVRELKTLLAKKEEYAGELVQSLTQADLQTSSDEIHALKTEHQILKNDLAMWEKEYGLLEENFNIEVSWAFLKSRRDALMEAAQEGFDLQSELAKVVDTIEKSQQSTDTPSPVLEAPGTEELLNEEVATAAIGVAIPAPEGETSDVPNPSVTS
uniref:Uncharacterized protein n=1 Tax=Nicotiana tabacum TaxID=4097 RepID=A0A1S3YDM4_TOBAC|nr:PREDICTED: uncharacterized protein LOC107775143 [Nicotiana tabacum]